MFIIRHFGLMESLRQWWYDRNIVFFQFAHWNVSLWFYGFRCRRSHVGLYRFKLYQLFGFKPKTQEEVCRYQAFVERGCHLLPGEREA